MRITSCSSFNSNLFKGLVLKTAQEVPPEQPQPPQVPVQSQDANDLSAWLENNRENINEAFPHNTETALRELRQILGRIMTKFNDISEKYKNAVRYGAHVPELAQALPEIAGLPQTQVVCGEIMNAIANVTRKVSTYGVTYNQHPIFALRRILHAIMQMRFTDQEVQMIQQIATRREETNTRPSEVNARRVEEILRKSIYKDQNAEVVLRECLQNAADAANKRASTEEGHAPSVDVEIVEHGEDKAKMFDLVVTDNGVGMNWETLSQKFFVLAETGKTEEGATGGFGIASGVIQGFPQHGWSVESNEWHSSRHGKNMYMGSDTMASYEPIRAKIQAAPGGGTALGLYGVPASTEKTSTSLYDLEALCRRYASDTLKIICNGKPVVPEFALSTMTPIGSDHGFDLPSLISTAFEDDTERQTATRVVDRRMSSAQSEMPVVDLGPQTTIQFYARPDSFSYAAVMLNGQFQFKTNTWIPKLAVVVDIRTRVRPGENDYPMSPGRDSLRSPYDSYVTNILQFLSGIMNEINSLELFREGLNFHLFNKDNEPLTTDLPEADAPKSDMNNLLTAAVGAVFSQPAAPVQPAAPQAVAPIAAPAAPAAEVPGFEGVEEEQAVPAVSAPVPVAAPVPTPAPTSIPIPAQLNFDAMPAVLARAVEQATQTIDLTPQAKEVKDAFVAALKNARKETVNVQEVLDRIVEGISTPCAVAVQRNFVSVDTAHRHPEVIKSLVAVWGVAVRRIVSDAIRKLKVKKSAKYIPGLVFSDDVLSLYTPPREERTMHTISINPLAVAAVLDKELYDRIMSGAAKTTQNQMHEMSAEDAAGFDEPLAQRVTAFLYTQAVHEATHFLFPGGDYEFHKNVSRVQLSSAFAQRDLLKEVRNFLPGLRKENRQLLKMIGKDAQAATTASWIAGNCKFAKKS